MTTLVTTMFFLSPYWSKTMEREKRRVRIRITCEYLRPLTMVLNAYVESNLQHVGVLQ